MLYVTCYHSTGHILIYHRILLFLYFIIVFCYCVYCRPGFLRCPCTIYFPCSLFSVNKNFFEFEFEFEFEYFLLDEKRIQNNLLRLSNVDILTVFHLLLQMLFDFLI